MKRILPLILTILLVGCETKEDIQSDIEKLRTQRTIIENINADMKEVQYELADETELLMSDINMLRKDKNVMKMYRDGETPKHIITFELKQSHFSLDITKHMKDGMNKIRFDLPVDREFYESVEVGDKIVDEFRTGSFLMNSSLGSWKMIIKNKTIK